MQPDQEFMQLDQEFMQLNQDLMQPGLRVYAAIVRIIPSQPSLSQGWAELGKQLDQEFCVPDQELMLPDQEFMQLDQDFMQLDQVGAYAAWIKSLCSNCENNTILAQLELVIEKSVIGS